MKQLSVFVCSVVLAIVLLPCYASAQGSDPPTCCWDGPKFVLPGNPQASSGVTNQIVMSDDSLRTMAMSRSDLVDRLVGSLFFGKSVDLIVPVSLAVESSARILRPGSQVEEYAAAEGTLLSAQEKRLYQMPRSRLRAPEIDALDHFYLTDGLVYIEIIFKQVDSSAATR